MAVEEAGDGAGDATGHRRDGGGATHDGAQVRGRSRDILLRTAARLFAERGPGAVSARQVAREAGVNYALIHRHFATKEGLLDAVLADLSERAASQLRSAAGRPGDALVASEDQDQLWRIIGFLCLENGDYIRTHVDVHPGFQALRAVVDTAEADPELAAVRSGIGAAMVLGWVILRPFVDTLAGLTDIPDEVVTAELGQALQRAMLPDADVDLTAVDLRAADGSASATRPDTH